MSQSLALVGESLTPSVTFDVGGTATPPTGTPTVAVTDIAGAAVSTGSVTVASTTVSTTITARSTPDVLTLAWSATVSGASRVRRTYIEVVGGEYFSLHELKQSDPSLANYDGAALADALERAARDVERVIGFALVPRAAQETIIPSCGGELAASWGRIRSLRAATVAGTTTSVTGLIVRNNYVTGGAFDEDYPVTLTYEHGLDAPPADLAAAVMALARIRAMAVNSGVPDRAERYVSENGRTFVLSSPTAGRVGVPEIDAVLHRYRTPGIA